MQLWESKSIKLRCNNFWLPHSHTQTKTHIHLGTRCNRHAPKIMLAIMTHTGGYICIFTMIGCLYFCDCALIAFLKLYILNLKIKKFFDKNKILMGRYWISLSGQIASRTISEFAFNKNKIIDYCYNHRISTLAFNSIRQNYFKRKC